MSKLRQKVALVTEGSRGIGTAIAKRPAANVANVAITYTKGADAAASTVQKALPLLNDGGSIAVNGSVARAKGTPGFGVYGASKAALRNLVGAWTVELKDRGIRSNVISPGPTDTPIVAGVPPEELGQMVASIPMGRMGKDEEIARVALFLASDDSSFVTGIELFVDGGRGQV